MDGWMDGWMDGQLQMAVGPRIAQDGSLNHRLPARLPVTNGSPCSSSVVSSPWPSHTHTLFGAGDVSLAVRTSSPNRRKRLCVRAWCVLCACFAPLSLSLSSSFFL